MSDFGSRVAEASAMLEKIYWLPGKYVVEIEEVKYVTKRKNAFVVVGRNLKSNNNERPVGMSCSMVRLEQWEGTFGEAKAFIANTYGITPDEVDADAVNLVVSASNPMAGKVVNLTVVRQDRSEKNKSPFDKHYWEFFAGDEAEIEELKRNVK